MLPFLFPNHQGCNLQPAVVSYVCFPFLFFRKFCVVNQCLFPNHSNVVILRFLCVSLCYISLFLSLSLFISLSFSLENSSSFQSLTRLLSVLILASCACMCICECLCAFSKNYMLLVRFFLLFELL